MLSALLFEALSVRFVTAVLGLDWHREQLLTSFSIGRPTYEFPHPLARVPQSAGYWLSYIVVDLLIWWGIRGYINDFRKWNLKLAPIAYFSLYCGSVSHLPTAYMWSRHVMPKPSDWGPQVDVVGYCFLNLGSKYQPPEEFVQWIQKGPQPIYIGFGSMRIALMIGCSLNVWLWYSMAVLEPQLQDKGWDNILVHKFFIVVVFLAAYENVNSFLPTSDCIGSSFLSPTRCPTTIVPFFGDQFFWGERIYEKGLGPAPIPISQLNVESLSDAVQFMLQPEVKSQAMEIAKLIENEDGLAAAVDAFHRHLPSELPLPRSFPQEDDQPNPSQWFFIQIGKLCCLPCGS
ncbi:Sterol 3-beta-glucosyltransferase UGT80B1 [Camellia lanceoleosa]|uniref:Sterol 3-beta-glucosyltransferase UGT80B1 n=1 Tax=Camellia lanceoleosa TaxID=1840588 RepID=A0ACC0GTJ6_9ERIC|nr:Sterol 3-beta-glucosyltransferase UGT80B1 [Camellia lanceoleosa]